MLRSTWFKVQAPKHSAAIGLILLFGWASGCADQAAESQLPIEIAQQAGDFRIEDLPTPASLPLARTSLTVEEAYLAIPHRRTQFNFERSLMSTEEAAYLQVAFRTVEEATRSRVSLLMELSEDATRNKVSAQQTLDGAEALAEVWQEMTPPAALAAYHSDISKALVHQLSFFRSWLKDKDSFPYNGHKLATSPEVRSSSQSLRHAYSELMHRYPGEGATNKNALFDYHCALDFL